MAEQRQWTHEELKSFLEKESIANLETLIANPGRKYRPEFARDAVINALRSIAVSDVLPDDIRVLVQRILTLYETASDPFLGMNLSTESERPQSRPLQGIDAADAEAQVRQDWSNDE